MSSATEWSVEVDPETARLETLASFDILDTPTEEAFDRIARLTSQIFGVEIAIVSMIDGHRQWYKAVEGLPTKEASLAETFCRHTMISNEMLVVPDATLDARFQHSPHVLGEPHVRFYVSAPLLTNGGDNLGTICAISATPREFDERDQKILRDLAGMVMHELALRQIASVDSLTNCLARRAFKADGQRHIALATRHRHELSLIAFDLDHFKAINDSQGHAGGDAVLRAVADGCRDELRQTDLFGRLGGEEFAVLLPQTGAEGGAEVAEKLRRRIEGLSEKFGFPVSASFGVAQMAGTEDVDTLLDLADQAVYGAKENGRNQIVRANSLTLSGPRRRVLKAGKIVFNNGRSTIDCTVRALGSDSADLHVFSAIGIPEEFILTFGGGSFVTKCRTVSQSRNRLDVRFC